MLIDSGTSLIRLKCNNIKQKVDWTNALRKHSERAHSGNASSPLETASEHDVIDSLGIEQLEVLWSE